MALLTYEALLAIQQRLVNKETTIEDEAVAYSLAELAEAIHMTRGMLLAIAESWSPAQLSWRPPVEPADASSATEDRWSATEALTHLVGTQNWYLLHMGRLLGRQQRFETMPRGLGDLAHQDVSREEVTTQLRAASEELVDFIATIPADADLMARRPSTFFGDLSLRGWALLAARHDLDHLLQIQRLSEMEGFPAAS